MAKTILHAEGESSAHALIRAGHYDMATPWSFSAEDGNALLGPKGDDWNKYGRWHLGEDASEPEDTKAHWKYPYGKDGKVYRRALASIRSRASQEGDNTIFEAAGRLMTAMNDEEEKKESSMSLRTRLLGSASRFGHFARPGPAAKAREERDEHEDEEEASKASKAEEGDEEEAKRKAEEDEEARKARKARRARRARKSKRASEDDRDPDRDEDEDEDGDEAADDKESEEDDADMRRAAAAGHDFAMEAAFRAGARSQRRRCAAILACPEAAANPVMAMKMAFETTMTAGAAIDVLKTTPAARTGGLAGRMAASGIAGLRVAPSAPGAPSGAAAIAAGWDVAMKDVVPAR